MILPVLNWPELPAGLVLLVETVVVATCVQDQELAEGVGDLNVVIHSQSHQRSSGIAAR